MRRINFLITAWEGGGNIGPLVETARKLTVRGHRVRFMSDECNRAEAEAVGAAFISWKRAPNRAERCRETQACRDWEMSEPGAGIVHVIRDVWAGPALEYAQDVMDELQREPADLVITAEMVFGAMVACERLGQKFAIFSANVSLKPLPGVPPLGPGLLPAKTPEERAMHAQVTQAVVMAFDSGLPALNKARMALGLAPLEHLLDQFEASTVDLLATSHAFDWPAEHLPAKVRYVGPQLTDPAWAKKWESPWPASDTRPLVTVGFSTTFQNHAGVLQKVIDALSTLPVRVLVTLGGSIERGEMKAAANTAIVESAPHSQVMQQAKLVVTHGGHGTVMRALVSRVPMLVIPHGRDQSDNAARVTARDAGLVVQAGASVEEIRAACAALLNDPRFLHGAQRLGDQVAHEAEHSQIVAELETAAGIAQSAAA